MSSTILVKDLKDIYGENLLSVILYGQNTDSEQYKEESGQNIIVIFNKLEASDIKNAIVAIKKWIKAKNALPIIMSESEWQNSADVYPIEYIEIKNNYEILYGKNVVDPISVSKYDLRLQCEYEIKNLLVRIRQIYLGNSDNPKFIVKNLEELSSKLIRILKSALHLFDVTAPDEYSEVIQKIAEKAKFDGEIFVEILSAKENKRKFTPQKIEGLVQRAVNSTDLLYKFINDVEIGE
ncbi:MAG: hypothetical protein WCG23_00905 [bacterium]